MTALLLFPQAKASYAGFGYWFPAVFAYMLGSIPWGYLIVKRREGRDIRASGSGNIGATNVARSAGPVAGVVTLLLDVAKGILAVWGARWITDGDITLMMGAAVMAVMGHMFPVWLKFKGGKGVATGVGAFVMICWPAVAGALAVWIVVVAIWRYVSLASVIASASLPLLTYRLYSPLGAPPLAVSIGTTLIAALIIVKHKDNIGRLVAGTENRLKLRK
ncbi:MAG: glycerol-3-phosphate 1-O-acyltransferase PlsY [Acidobacteria bacterium]|nr:glycerol-3-phosphate 1-O-acyltransferase PlsY [Acidobacteriota bacterium]MBI3664057.1 glycerol-3-phosphate 1-O-acyltransferase PlsY [Acidobacteriota bacterium]